MVDDNLLRIELRAGLALVVIAPESGFAKAGKVLTAQSLPAIAAHTETGANQIIRTAAASEGNLQSTHEEYRSAQLLTPRSKPALLLRVNFSARCRPRNGERRLHHASIVIERRIWSNLRGCGSGGHPATRYREAREARLHPLWRFPDARLGDWIPFDTSEVHPDGPCGPGEPRG